MPVSANVLACKAAICAAMANCGVTCVPEASNAATFSTGLEAAATAAADAAAATASLRRGAEAAAAEDAGEITLLLQLLGGKYYAQVH